MPAAITEHQRREAAPPTDLQLQVQALTKLVNDGQTFRVQLEGAKQDELDAYRNVQHLQSKILVLLGSPEARESGECLNRIAALKVQLSEGESKWRSCVQAAGVLREQLDAITAEADGRAASPPPGGTVATYPSTQAIEAGGGGGGALVVVSNTNAPSSLSPPRGGRAAAIPVESPTLDNIKPVLLRAWDIGRSKTVPPMVQPAYPPVAPRYGYNPALPTAELTEERLRTKFDELDVNGNGVLCAKEMEHMFDSLGSFGMPQHGRRFIEQGLRRSGMLDDDVITYEEFSILVLKWASL